MTAQSAQSGSGMTRDKFYLNPHQTSSSSFYDQQHHLVTRHLLQIEGKIVLMVALTWPRTHHQYLILGR